MTPTLQPALDGDNRQLVVSVISVWEVAMLVARRRLVLDRMLEQWLDLALASAGVQLFELSPVIAVESTMLPGEFHRDPADQILVATARNLDCPIATADEKILRYEHVKTLR